MGNIVKDKECLECSQCTLDTDGNPTCNFTLCMLHPEYATWETGDMFYLNASGVPRLIL